MGRRRDAMRDGSFADGVLPKRRVGLRRAYVRIADIVMAGSCLALLTPMLVLVAVTLKINSPGPFFVRQWRYGYRNRRILIHKFRTTFATGAEADLPTFVGTI